MNLRADFEAWHKRRANDPDYIHATDKGRAWLAVSELAAGGDPTPYPARYVEFPVAGERGFDARRFDMSELDVELRAILASTTVTAQQLAALHKLLRDAVGTGAAGGE